MFGTIQNKMVLDLLIDNNLWVPKLSFDKREFFFHKKRRIKSNWRVGKIEIAGKSWG